MSLIPEVVHLADPRLLCDDELRATRRRHTRDVGAFIELFDQATSREWPLCTDEMCRWCMHTFAWFPIGLPVRYDEARCRMVMKGYFCSFACTMAYALAQVPDARLDWLAVLALRLFGIARIRTAPPREFLNKMPIEEFRAASKEVEYAPVYNAAFFQREAEYVEARPDRVVVCATTTNTSGASVSATTTTTTTGLRPPPSVDEAQSRAQTTGVMSMLRATKRQRRA